MNISKIAALTTSMYGMCGLSGILNNNIDPYINYSNTSKFVKKTQLTKKQKKRRVANKIAKQSRKRNR